MLYWFSGTGNSRYVAGELSRLLGCKSVCMTHELSSIGINRDNGDIVGFCFPVYSWGVPQPVLEFMRDLKTEHLKGKYIYAVLTCGDEAGLAAEVFRKALNSIGVKLSVAFTIIMPNNYVMLPGFGIDSKEVEIAKLQASSQRIAYIAKRIMERSEIDNVFRGSKAWLKTKLIYPLFRRWGVKASRWNVDTSLCIGCGKCAKACPANNITLKDGVPEWGNLCWSCTACYHSCPKRAIDYGRFTRGKGQYNCPLNPDAQV